LPAFCCAWALSPSVRKRLNVVLLLACLSSIDENH
jgi:hypothetical protein